MSVIGLYDIVLADSNSKWPEAFIHFIFEQDINSQKSYRELALRQDKGSKRVYTTAVNLIGWDCSDGRRIITFDEIPEEFSEFKIAVKVKMDEIKTRQNFDNVLKSILD